MLLLVLLKPLDCFIQLSRIGLGKLLERNPGVGQPRRGNNLALRRHVQDCGHDPGRTGRVFGVADGQIVVDQVHTFASEDRVAVRRSAQTVV